MTESGAKPRRWRDGPRFSSALLASLALHGFALAAILGGVGEGALSVARRGPVAVAVEPARPREALPAGDPEPAAERPAPSAAEPRPPAPSPEPELEVHEHEPLWRVWTSESQARALSGTALPRRELPHELPTADPTPAPPADAPSVASASSQGGEPAVWIEGPDPVYPRASVSRGEEGVVLCRLQVDVEGRVTSVEVVESSGAPRLDRAAREALARWRFRPALEGGRAVPAELLHRVVFRLDAS